MKHSIKGPARKYIRREQQFSSSQISTVTEVNPSCQSEQSMLEKIIFHDRNQLNNRNNCDPKRNKNAIYTSRDSKLYERRKSNVMYQKQLRNYGNVQYGRYNRSPSFKTQRQSNINQHHSKAQQYNINKFSSQNPYQIHQLSSQQAFSSSTSQIDQYKLQRIQQKIKSYQMKQNSKENKENEKPPYINRSHYDTMEKELSKIQINPAPIKMKKQQFFIDNIKDENFMTERRTQDPPKGKSFQFESSIDRFTKNSQKCLQTIYDLVLIDRALILSPTNITLKNSIKQEIKLVLGPIFADVTIKGKSISKKQFIERANQILSSYRDEQIQDVFFSIVNNLSKSSKDQQKFFSRNDDRKQQRVPGRVLKNSKASHETKQKQKSRDIEKVHNTYFSHFHDTPSNNLTTRTSVERYHPTQRVSKKVYIQQAQMLEHGQTERTLTKKSPTKMSLNHHTLEMMLSEERLKKQQSTFEKKEGKGMKVLRNDDELERLNNLERKFNEHFRSQGKL